MGHGASVYGISAMNYSVSIGKKQNTGANFRHFGKIRSENVQSFVQNDVQKDLVMQEITLSEARKNFSHIVSESVQKDDMAISVRGNPLAVLVSASRYEEYRKALLKEELKPIFEEFDDVFKALADK